MAGRDFARERLDKIATDFLSDRGVRIAAEPTSQVIGWVRRPKKRVASSGYVPLASFFDLPVEAISRPPPGGTRWPEMWVCTVCNGVCHPSGSARCKRCSKRATRAKFIEKWAQRSSNGQSVLDAILTASAWDGGEGDRHLIAVVAVIPDREAHSALKEALAEAVDHNAEPEVFRAILIEHGFEDFINARDARTAAIHVRRLKGRGPSRLPDVAELAMCGLCPRSISRATGLSKGTVARYLWESRRA